MKYSQFFIIPIIAKLKFCSYNLDCPLPSVCCEKGPIKYCCVDSSRKLVYIPIDRNNYNNYNDATATSQKIENTKFSKDAYLYYNDN
jgi:hypothetical protein